VRALRGVTRGEAPLSREAATLLVEGVQSIGIAADARDRVAALSIRELEVLDLMSRGHSNRAISLELGLSEFTAKHHVQNILCKLVHSRLEASATYHSFVERTASTFASVTPSVPAPMRLRPRSRLGHGSSR
jgi:DNA-binding NarL/FixJ family response regulator